MIFHTFGNKENKAVMLIHGMLHFMNDNIR
jgi:hypothetical protein